MDSSERGTNRTRWEKARDAELQHFTEISTPQIVSQERAKDILSHWGLTYEHFRNKKVLAVGGGTGIIHLLSESECAVSLDPLNNFIYHQIDSYSDAEALTGAGEDLPFSSNSFDIIISANVIDHTANPQKSVSEIARVLKPDGEFLFEVNIFRSSKLMRKMADQIDRPHPHHFDAVDVQKLLLSSFDEAVLTSTTQIPFGASPAMLNRLKIFVANTIFGLRKVYYICRQRTN